MGSKKKKKGQPRTAQRGLFLALVLAEAAPARERAHVHNAQSILGRIRSHRIRRIRQPTHLGQEPSPAN